MSPDPNRVESVFAAALALAVPEQRVVFLDLACLNDPALRARVDALLQAHRAAGSFLKAPVPGLAATVDERPLVEQPGMSIGSYKLLQQIGEGGMGVVYMAEQQEPVRRKVALKIIKPGMDSGQVIARFEAERQALAMMEHQNIACVLDAGTTASGRLQKLIDDLESKKFPVRNAAYKELEELGTLAAGALRQAQAKKSSLELRRRIEALLDKLRGPMTQPELLRAIRAAGILENIASPEARKQLETLGKGDPDAPLTQEAERALKRLTQKAKANK